MFCWTKPSLFILQTPTLAPSNLRFRWRLGNTKKLPFHLLLNPYFFFPIVVFANATSYCIFLQYYTPTINQTKILISEAGRSLPLYLKSKDLYCHKCWNFFFFCLDIPINLFISCFTTKQSKDKGKMIIKDKIYFGARLSSRV